MNLRYLQRAGLPTGAATSALAGLAIVGVATDAAYATGITVVGPALGLTGAAAEMQALAGRGAQAGMQYRWLLAAALVALFAVVLARTRGSVVGAVTRVAAEAARHIRELLVRPWRLGAAALASTVTTAAMSLGFVVAVEAWGQAATPLPVGALLAVYLVAAAVDGASPLPPWMGTAELIMIGALTLAGYTAGSAILSVVIFRAVTYWLALPIGLWSARRLRRLALL